MNIFEIDNYIRKKFFIIDRNNFTDFDNQLYGYMIGGNAIYVDTYPDACECDNELPGVFIKITNTDTEIIIKQDFMGGYGLFLYRSADYFALSNSLLYLVYYLKDSRKLTINDDFIDLVIACGLTPLAYSETYINEIEQVPPNSFIRINKRNKVINIENTNIHNYNIDIDSPEAFKLIDSWHDKYHSLLNYLLSNGQKVSMDLSGGIDSRVALSIIKGSSTNLNKLSIHSINDNLHTHSGDYKIASLICDKLHLHMNKVINRDSFPLTNKESIALSFFSKFLYHSEFYFNRNFNRYFSFRFTGGGGEGLRKHWSENGEDFINKKCCFGKFKDYDFTVRSKEILRRELNRIVRTTCNKLPDGQNVYIKTRLRNHFLKSCVESFLVNNIAVTPLIDPSLYKIDQNNDNLLFAVILDRYLPELKQIDFDSGRKFDDSIWQSANNLNAKYPLVQTKKQNSYILLLNKTNMSERTKEIVPPPLHDVFLHVYQTPEVTNYLISRFSQDTYIHAITYSKNHKFFPQRYIIRFIQIYLLYKLLNNSSRLLNIELPEIVKYFNSGLTANILLSLLTARIDIILRGNKDNRIKILDDSENKFTFHYPAWFNYDNGQGVVIESHNLKLDFSFVCDSNGKLKIAFLGKDIRDMANNFLPVIIDYNNVTIKHNDKIIFDGNKQFSAWHEQRKNFDLDVLKGDIIYLSCSWLPHDYKFIELSYLIQSIYSQGSF